MSLSTLNSDDYHFLPAPLQAARHHAVSHPIYSIDIEKMSMLFARFRDIGMNIYRNRNQNTSYLCHLSNVAKQYILASCRFRLTVSDIRRALYLFLHTSGAVAKPHAWAFGMLSTAWHRRFQSYFFSKPFAYFQS